MSFGTIDRDPTREYDNIRTLRVDPHSNYLLVSDIYNQIAHGNATGHYSLRKFGQNPDIGVTLETVWDEGGLYSYPTSAGPMRVSSSSALDTALGTGARTVQIYGLDSSYDEISEVITLAGQAHVWTFGYYRRVYRMKVLSAGTGGQNAGTLYVGTGGLTAGKPANVFGSVKIGHNQSLMALWTIPRDYMFFMTSLYVSINAVKPVEIELRIRPFGEVFQTKEAMYLTGNSQYIPFEIPQVYTEKSDIEIRAKAGATGAGVSASFTGFYMESAMENA